MIGPHHHWLKSHGAGVLGRVVSTIRQGALWIFINRRTGALTVTQWPNVALSIFLVLSITHWIAHPLGVAKTSLDLLAGIALAIWSIDELLRGVNPFRRILGMVVLLLTIRTFVSLLH